MKYDAENGVCYCDGGSISVDEEGMVKVDGVTVFKLVKRNDNLRFQFYDRDRMRSACRGSQFIEIDFQTVIKILEDLIQTPHQKISAEFTKDELSDYRIILY